MNVKQDSLVVQANYLIEHRPDFTKDETRMFLTIVASIDKDATELTPLEIPVREFAELWGVDNSNAVYERVKEALRGLRRKEFFLEDTNPETGKKRFLVTGYVSSAVYEDGSGYATVKIDDVFKPWLLALQSSFTSYHLKSIMTLSTVPAIRFYELLKQYLSLGKRVMTLAEIREMLHLQSRYPDNTDLKRYVIEPAIKEINETTDILVQSRYGGRGKRANVTFSIKTKAALIETTAVDKDQTNLEAAARFGYDTSYHRLLASACNYEFNQREIDGIAALLKIRIPDRIDVFISVTHQARFDFLSHAYEKMLEKEQEGVEIQNRLTYLRGIIQNLEVEDKE